MPVRFQKWITRQDLQSNPDTYYVFGDNGQGVGLGGQAKEMRGEPNAIGVPTKWAPGMEEYDFFHDTSLGAALLMNDGLRRIKMLIDDGHTIIFPSDGLGTGLSMLPVKAPGLYKQLYDTVERFAGGSIPWEKPSV